jgi:hypothetical protein
MWHVCWKGKQKQHCPQRTASTRCALTSTKDSFKAILLCKNVFLEGAISKWWSQLYGPPLFSLNHIYRSIRLTIAPSSKPFITEASPLSCGVSVRLADAYTQTPSTDEATWKSSSVKALHIKPSSTAEANHPKPSSIKATHQRLSTSVANIIQSSVPNPSNPNQHESSPVKAFQFQKPSFPESLYTKSTHL